MGAGDLPAGMEDAGDDITPGAASARVTPFWNALLIDPTTRDFPRDADGNYIALHPVDARVELAMMVVQGTIATAPDLGNALRNIAYITSSTVKEVTYEVRNALNDEVLGGNIRIVSIRVDTSIPGRILVELQYVNLRANARGAPTRTVRATVGNG